jgi:hypothetical protein
VRWAAPISRSVPQRSAITFLVSSLARLIPRIRLHATRRRFAKSLRRVRRNGFAERSPDVQPKSANTFSVPIRHGRKVLATLGLSYFISAMPKTKAIASYVPPLLSGQEDRSERSRSNKSSVSTAAVARQSEVGGCSRSAARLWSTTSVIARSLRASRDRHGDVLATTPNEPTVSQPVFRMR